LKDEQFLANLFNVIDYLADWFGWFVDVGHDAERILFCVRKVGSSEGNPIGQLYAFRQFRNGDSESFRQNIQQGQADVLLASFHF
jgi:hypothetical protein